MVEEVLAHPAYPTAVWKLKPTQSGMLPVASGRGGPFNIYWEVHGTGDIKLVVCFGWILLRSRGIHPSSWHQVLNGVFLLLNAVSSSLTLRLYLNFLKTRS